MILSNVNQLLQDFPNITPPTNIKLSMYNNKTWSYVKFNDFIQIANSLKSDPQNYPPGSSITEIDSIINLMFSNISNSNIYQPPQYVILKFEENSKTDYLPKDQQSLFFVLIDVFSQKEIITIKNWLGFLSELSTRRQVWNQIS